MIACDNVVLVMCRRYIKPAWLAGACSCFHPLPCSSTIHLPSGPFEAIVWAAIGAQVKGVFTLSYTCACLYVVCESSLYM